MTRVLFAESLFIYYSGESEDFFWLLGLKILVYEE